MDLSKQDLLTMLIRAERGPGLEDRDVFRLRQVLEACPHCLRVSRIVRSRTTIRVKAPDELADRLRTLLVEQGSPSRTTTGPGR